MADDSEKTEHESQKKLEDSRKKGEFPRSQELATFVVFFLFLTYFSMTRLAWFHGFGDIAADLLRFDRHMNIDADTLGEFLAIPVWRSIKIVAPLFGLILLISPFVSLAQSGFNIAQDKLAPDWSRLDPIQGFQKIFSLHQTIEGAKSSAKIGLFAAIVWKALRERLPEIEMLGGLGLGQQIQTMLDIAITIGKRVAVTMAILAVLDYGYQWWEFHKKMRLSHQELKDEAKEREGNPMIRQRQRSLQMQAARKRMMADASRADVIVTNPTHYAVALRYDKTKSPAPYVCAKGKQFMALRLREMAREKNIPLIENRPLARALYAQVKVGQTIPSQFYRAVAEILAFVFLLKRDPARARQRQKASRIQLAPAIEGEMREAIPN
jgi:flagellar biosynthetic protein FlhB